MERIRPNNVWIYIFIICFATSGIFKIKHYIEYHSTKVSLGTKLKYFFEPTRNKVTWNYAKLPNSKHRYEKISNNDSLFDTKNYSISKPKDTFRIIVLGDSYTDGAYVSTKDTWPELIEKKFNKNLHEYSKIEVINLGVYSYDLQYSVNRLLTRGLKYNPDLVVLFTHNEDRYQINEILFPKIKEYNSLKNRDTSTLYADWIYAHDYIHDQYSNKKIFDFQITNLNLLRAKYNGNFVIITPDSIDTDYLSYLDSFVENNINVYLFSEVTTYNNPSLNFSDKHLNIEGHQKTAEEIYLILSTFIRIK